MSSRNHFETVMQTCGGRIVCRRCQAFSKRTKKQCQGPAVEGKTKCRFHGGKSTGPRTAEGKQRVIDVNTVHGLQTKLLREQYRKDNLELARLEQCLLKLGMKAPRTPGRKPLGLQSRGGSLA